MWKVDYSLHCITHSVTQVDKCLYTTDRTTTTDRWLTAQQQQQMTCCCQRLFHNNIQPHGQTDSFTWQSQT